ncbi:MAG: glycosyltransferase family 4 protein [bacterium]|nr:glycosyltransferase family 4 protein [bacterium]
MLMVICQRVGATGSGVVFRELFRRASLMNVEYGVLYGGTSEDDEKDVQIQRSVAYLDRLTFESDSLHSLPFPIVGMSPTMPYESLAFCDLNLSSLRSYVEAWHRKLVSSVAAFEPHLLHVHHLWLLAAISAMSFDEMPVCVSVHGTDLFTANDCTHLKPLVEPWIARLHTILSPTKELTDGVKTTFGVNTKNFEVLGNGFDRAMFRPEPSTPIFDAPLCDLNNLRASKVALCVAKYDRRKGIDWLIKAFAALPQTGRGRFKLLVVGSGPNSEAERYREIAETLGISRDVVLLGGVSHADVARLMNVVSVVVCPSFREPFGLTVLEGLACGCRIVVTDQGGPPEFIPRSLRKCGSVLFIRGVESLNPSEEEELRFVQELAKALDVQLRKPLDFNVRRKISAALQHLSWDGVVERLSGLYAELSARPKKT